MSQELKNFDFEKVKEQAKTIVFEENKASWSENFWIRQGFLHMLLVELDKENFIPQFHIVRTMAGLILSGLLSERALRGLVTQCANAPASFNDRLEKYGIPEVASSFLYFRFSQSVQFDEIVELDKIDVDCDKTHFYIPLVQKAFKYTVSRLGKSIIIYNRACTSSLYADLDKLYEKEDEFGVVKGCPGTGKSIMTWSWFLQKIKRTKTTGLWVKLSHGKHPSVFVSCSENGGKIIAKIKKFIGSNLQVLLEKVQHSFTVFDGYRQAIPFHDAILQYEVTPYILVTSGGYKKENEPLELFIHQFPSWRRDEYIEACKFNGFWDSVKPQFVLSDNQSIHHSADYKEDVIIRKHYFAGGSARWMFSVEERQLQREVDEKVDKVRQGELQDILEGNADLHNHIRASFSETTKYFVVSPYVMDRLYDRLDGAEFLGTVKRILGKDFERNKVLYGYFLELQFFEKVKSSKRDKRIRTSEGQISQKLMKIPLEELIGRSWKKVEWNIWDIRRLKMDPKELKSAKNDITKGTVIVFEQNNYPAADFFFLEKVSAKTENQYGLVFGNITCSSSHGIKFYQILRTIKLITRALGVSISWVEFSMILPSYKTPDFKVGHIYWNPPGRYLDESEKNSMPPTREGKAWTNKEAYRYVKVYRFNFDL